jgi:hypothetical protein
MRGLFLSRALAVIAVVMTSTELLGYLARDPVSALRPRLLAPAALAGVFLFTVSKISSHRILWWLLFALVVAQLPYVLGASFEFNVFVGARLLLALRKGFTVVLGASLGAECVTGWYDVGPHEQRWGVNVLALLQLALLRLDYNHAVRSAEPTELQS